MEKIQFKTYNLDIRRPKVLVIGNGLVHGQSISWGDLIRRVSREDVDISAYEELDSNGYIKFLVPNTVLTLSTSVVNDKERHEKYLDILNRNSYPKNDLIHQLLKLPFDAILTTNYTYEIESELNPRYPNLKSPSKRKYAYTLEGIPDRRYLIHTFNRVLPNGPDIWHIHGELRCPSSMILSHDEYARHINMILLYNKKRGNDYEKYRNSIICKSWIDYFLVGDVYVLGLGMDFSEFDLWWLLGRRMREKNGCGDIYFYEPTKANSKIKQRALQDAGVNVETCNIDIDNGDTYNIFYQMAIEDIKNKLEV